MRQKELRIALVCYGGISLAVYMHGVTKELWKLARASRAHLNGGDGIHGVEVVYRDMLRSIEAQHDLRLRVLPDIVAGASAGGINGVFLAQAIHSGQSLEPLTALWLERADVDVLLDPDARLATRFLKYWAVPVVNFLLSRPGNMVSASVAPETRAEVRGKLSRLVRSRWFEAPFGGIGFSRLLAEALDAMAAGPVSAPLLPRGHPLDLFVTVTDFKGHLEKLRLNSPPEVDEGEHRLTIGFRRITPAKGGPLAETLELVLAARATASFPGAFPALQIAEIDALSAERKAKWPTRAAFLARVLPHLTTPQEIAGAALIDGSVLVNAPFAEAMSVLSARPAQREVDRRFVYIDPHPQRVGGMERSDPRPPNWFSVIFGSLSAIPREQPIRDNLDTLAHESREMERLRAVITALRADVEHAVEQLFGYTFFLDSPNQRRISAWRDKAQHGAAAQAGYAYQSYAQLKFAGVVDALTGVIAAATPTTDRAQLAHAVQHHLADIGLSRIANGGGGLTPPAIAFLREHDLAHRIRRLRLLARRLAEDWEEQPGVTSHQREAARDAVYQALALYFARDGQEALGPDFPAIAAAALQDPAAALHAIAATRQLTATDEHVDAVLAEAMAAAPKPLRRMMLLTYLGFPYYDVVTLPLLRGADLTEFDPVKVDRISPEDAASIRKGGADACLRGVEFYNFGAFFSRAYRENDYLWGRLHGAERMIDLVASSLADGGEALPAAEIARIKRAAFLAILDEEETRLTADPSLVSGIRAEVLRA